jgi:hypothetical protein
MAFSYLVEDIDHACTVFGQPGLKECGRTTRNVETSLAQTREVYTMSAHTPIILSIGSCRLVAEIEASKAEDHRVRLARDF